MEKEDYILAQPLARVYRKIQLQAQRGAVQQRYEMIMKRRK
jgi:hypothetical protein